MDTIDPQQRIDHLKADRDGLDRELRRLDDERRALLTENRRLRHKLAAAEEYASRLEAFYKDHYEAQWAEAQEEYSREYAKLERSKEIYADLIDRVNEERAALQQEFARLHGTDLPDEALGAPGRPPSYTRGQAERVHRLRAAGMSVRRIAREVGLTASAVQRLVCRPAR